ncbi:MAG: response regulator [Oligoflexus sp.]
MSNLPNKVLIVDSDPTIAGPLIEPMQKMGIELFVACDLDTALYRFNKQFFKVVFIELRFPKLDGLALIQKWRSHEVEEKRSAGFVLLTSAPPSKEQNALIKEVGRLAVVAKPLKPATMLTQMQKAYQQQVRYVLSYKIKKDIVERLDRDSNVKAAIEQVKEFKDALGDEYMPMLLELYQRSDSYNEALEFLKKIPPDSMDPLRRLNLLGKFSLKLGQLQEARQFFEEADSIAPKNMDRIKDMTQVYLELKIPEQAIEKQREIMSMSPESPDLKFDMFKQLEEHGFEEHAASFARDTSGPKEVIRYFNNKGVMMAQTKAPQEAIDEYQRALSYYPDNPDNYLIHFNIALALLRTRRVDQLAEAREHLDQCLSLRPDFEKARDLLGKLARKAG